MTLSSYCENSICMSLIMYLLIIGKMSSAALIPAHLSKFLADFRRLKRRFSQITDCLLFV